MSRYQRKTTRGLCTSVAMENALKAVKDYNMSVKRAAKEYAVPRTTLRRRVDNKNAVGCSGEKVRFILHL